MSKGKETTKNSLEMKLDPFPKEGSELSQERGEQFHTVWKMVLPYFEIFNIHGEKNWVHLLGPWYKSCHLGFLDKQNKPEPTVQQVSTTVSLCESSENLTHYSIVLFLIIFKVFRPWRVSLRGICGPHTIGPFTLAKIRQKINVWCLTELKLRLKS